MSLGFFFLLSGRERRTAGARVVAFTCATFRRTAVRVGTTGFPYSLRFTVLCLAGLLALTRPAGASTPAHGTTPSSSFTLGSSAGPSLASDTTGGDAPTASAEPPPLALDPNLAVTQYLHRSWQSGDGLPQNAIRTLTQTTDGYIWVGTQEGLARFDGSRFETYAKRVGAAPSDHLVARSVTPDENGGLWIGTAADGLYRLDGRSVRHFDAANGLMGASVSSVVISPDGEVLVGTFDGGLFTSTDGLASGRAMADAERSAELAFRVHDAQPNLPSTFITELIEDPAGETWIGTDQGLAVRRGDSTVVFGIDDGLPHPFITALHRDRRGRLWVGTRSGICRWAQGRCRPMDGEGAVPGDRMIFDITDDATGTLWIGTDGRGVIRYANGRFEDFASDEGLTNDRARSLLVDHEGSLWIGTEGGGLNQLRSGKFTVFDREEGLSENMVLSVYASSDQSLWVGTEGGGINRIRGREVTSFSSREGLPSETILSIQEPSRDALWVGTYGGGLSRLESGRFTRVGGDVLPSDNVFVLHPGRDNRLWIGTDAGLTLRSDAGYRTFTTDDGLTTNFVSSVLAGQSGNLWVGTYNGGLVRRAGDRFERVATGAGLDEAIVTALYEEAGGVLWVGTYDAGLWRIADGNAAHISRSQGLPGSGIYQILADDDRRLWMGSNQGIMSIPLDDLHAAANDSTETIDPTLYTTTDGLPGEVNGGFQPAGARGADGRLWFPTGQGVVAVDPDRVPVNTVPPPVHIASVEVDGSPHIETEPLSLDPGTEALRFEFSAPTFIAPSDTRFEYKLEGYNQSWRETSRRSVTYTNLDPGSYTLNVRATNADGVRSASLASMTVEQQPWAYQTWWFLVLISALGGRWSGADTGSVFVTCAVGSETWSKRWPGGPKTCDAKRIAPKRRLKPRRKPGRKSKPPSPASSRRPRLFVNRKPSRPGSSTTYPTSFGRRSPSRSVRWRMHYPGCTETSNRP